MITLISGDGIQISISHSDLDLMLMGYLRYSMGRKTYIVHACAQTVRELVPKLGRNSAAMFASELDRELSAALAKDEFLGMPMDHAEWVDLKYDLEMFAHYEVGVCAGEREND